MDSRIRDLERTLTDIAACLALARDMAAHLAAYHPGDCHGECSKCSQQAECRERVSLLNRAALLGLLKETDNA